MHKNKPYAYYTLYCTICLRLSQGIIFVNPATVRGRNCETDVLRRVFWWSSGSRKRLDIKIEQYMSTELPLWGRGACRPRCGRQASGTPKVWHGAAVTEGVRRALRARYQNLCKISNILIDCPHQKSAVRRKNIPIFYTIYTQHAFTAFFFCVILW